VIPRMMAILENKDRLREILTSPRFDTLWRRPHDGAYMIRFVVDEGRGEYAGGK